MHTRHGLGLSLGLATPRPRPGAARRASARTCGTPVSFYQLHKWSTVGPPFKLVKILIDFQCGIESLAFILWTFLFLELIETKWPKAQLIQHEA
jgi:hypothetical protein